MKNISKGNLFTTCEIQANIASPLKFKSMTIFTYHDCPWWCWTISVKSLSLPTNMHNGSSVYESSSRTDCLGKGRDDENLSKVQICHHINDLLDYMFYRSWFSIFAFSRIMPNLSTGVARSGPLRL